MNSAILWCFRLPEYLQQNPKCSTNLPSYVHQFTAFYESTHVTLSSHTLTHIFARFTRFTTSRSNSQAHLLRFYHSRGGCWCITAAAASLFSYLTSAKTCQRWISGVESSLNTSKTGHFSSICFFRGVGSPLQVSKILLATHVMITDNIHYMILHDYTYIFWKWNGRNRSSQIGRAMGTPSQGLRR